MISNIDATIIAQRPKMAPHIDEMRENVAKVLHLEVSQVNIKATTEEGLGFTGSGEGISAQAVAALETVANYSYTAASTEAAVPAAAAVRRCREAKSHEHQKIRDGRTRDDQVPL